MLLKKNLPRTRLKLIKPNASEFTNVLKPENFMKPTTRTRMYFTNPVQ